ncbi:ABC transporter permease subunit [Planctomycetota bacterium]
MIISAIAKTTFLENIRQPVYLVLTLLGMALIYCSQYVTMFVLGQETVTIIDTAFVTVLTVGILVSIFSASNLIYYEIESRTLMTVLSKPVKKEQIILGKFFGIVTAILLSSLILIGVLILTAYLSTKSNQDIVFDHVVLLYIIDVTVLTLGQLFIIVAVTILFATTFPITPTAVFTVLIFFLGHMVDLIKSNIQGNFLADSFAFVYSLVVPNLEFFNLTQILYQGRAIDNIYIIQCTLYAGIYILIYLVLAMLLFARKDFS